MLLNAWLPEDLLLLLAVFLLLEPMDTFSGVARDTEVALFLFALLLALSRDDELAEPDDFAAGAERDEESDAAGALSAENADADPAGLDEDELDDGAEPPEVTELRRLLIAGAPPGEVLPNVEVSPPAVLLIGPVALLRAPRVLVVEPPRLLNAEPESVEFGLGELGPGVLVEPPSSPLAVVPRVLVAESAVLVVVLRVLVTGSVGLVVVGLVDVGLSRLLAG